MNEIGEKEKDSFWRYALVTIFVVGIMILFQAILIGIAYLIEGNLDVFSYSPINLLWVSMLPFAGSLAVLLLGVRFLHQIPIKKFFTSSNQFRWNLFAQSALIWFFLAVISDIILSIFQPGNYQWRC